MLLYFISRLFITHEVTVYDIFLCRHTVQNILTWVPLRTVKRHPNFNIVKGVLSQGVLRTPSLTQHTNGLITTAIILTIKLKNYFSYNTQPCKCCTTFARLRVVAAIIFKFYRKFY